jgi:L-ascorbate metabolism protein UlaG (beta-lactamase superfamily)
MIPPKQSGAAFLADVAATRNRRAGARLWWLGQSGFLLQYQGHHLLIDPYLSDSLTGKYAGSDQPHVRITARVVDPNLLDFIDVVTSSHNHTDHLDGGTLNPLRTANPGLKLVLPEANRAFAAARLGCPPEWPLGLDDSQSLAVSPFTFHAIAAAHESVDRDEQSRCIYLGYVIEFGPWRLYHSGDCVLYEGLVEKVKPFAPDIALLPVNGSLPERRVAGNFWGREAAWLAHAIGARCAVPMHYGMFEFNTVSPDEFVEHCQRLGQPFRILENGEGMDLP